VIPDSIDNMIYCAEMIERAAHSMGWGSAPVLGSVSDLGGLGAGVKKFPVQPAELIPTDPLSALRNIADLTLERTTDHRKLITDAGMEGAGDALMALWFSCEAHLVPDGMEHEGMRASENPAGKTIRHVIIVDCGGYVFRVNRFRDEDPELLITDPGDTDKITYDREVLIALRRLLLGLGANMSTGAIDMDKVAQVGAGG